MRNDTSESLHSIRAEGPERRRLISGFPGVPEGKKEHDNQRECSFYCVPQCPGQKF
jgi:hypothetical protein